MGFDIHSRRSLKSLCMRVWIPLMGGCERIETPQASPACPRASMPVTPESRKLADFSDPYYRTPGRFVARRDTVFNDVRPERLEGKKVAVVAGTAHEAFLKALFTEVDVRPYDTPERTREALRKGEVDLLFADGISLAFW